MLARMDKHTFRRHARACCTHSGGTYNANTAIDVAHMHKAPSHV